LVDQQDRKLIDVFLDLTDGLEYNFSDVLSELGGHDRQFLQLLLMIIDQSEQRLEESYGDVGEAVENFDVRLGYLFVGFFQLRRDLVPRFLEFRDELVVFFLDFVQSCSYLLQGVCHGGDDSSEVLVSERMRSILYEVR